MLTVDMIQIEDLQRIFADIAHGEDVIHRRFQTLVNLDEVIFGQFDGRVLVEFRARFTADGDNDEIAWDRFACFQLNEFDGVIFALLTIDANVLQGKNVLAAYADFSDVGFGIELGAILLVHFLHGTRDLLAEDTWRNGSIDACPIDLSLCRLRIIGAFRSMTTETFFFS